MWTVNAIDVEYITVELIDNPVEINRIKREIETTKHDNTIDKKKKQQKLKELNLTFQLNNVLNKLYETNGYTYSYIYGSQTITENFYYPMAGRNFMAGINLKF